MQVANRISFRHGTVLQTVDKPNSERRVYPCAGLSDKREYKLYFNTGEKMSKKCYKELKEANKKCNENIRDIVIKESQDGNVVFASIDGLEVMNLQEFIKQPIEGILYDLNRDESVVLTFINDPKFVNDYAVAKVIRAMKQQIDELEYKLNANQETIIH